MLGGREWKVKEGVEGEVGREEGGDCKIVSA